MKKLLSLLLMLFMGMTAWAGTVTIWGEDWSTAQKDQTPSQVNSMYSQTGAGTKIYLENLAGGTSPELLVGKNGGSFTATINLNDASGDLILEYNCNKNIGVSSSTDGVTIGDATSSGNRYTRTITVPSYLNASTLVITFTQSTSQNARLDNIILYYEEGGTVIETVKTPTFNPEGGEITEAIEVEINCETEDATILYSFNQTDWNEYENPIEISETTTLYAKATKENMNDSQITSATYTFVDPTVSYAMFDFDNDYETLFPTITGTSSQSSSDGDILEDVTATVNSILLTVTPNPSGTPNRIWSGSPRLRMYGGQMTIAAPEGYVITNLEISQGKWNSSNSVNLGVLTSTSWEGNASTLVITIAGNTQFKYINVTYQPGQGDEPPTPQIKEISTIAEYKALPENSEFIFNGDVVCVQDYTANNHRYLYVADNNGGMIIYDPVGPQYQTCDIITGGWEGKKTTYQNLPEVTSATDFVASVETTNIEPIEITINDINETSYGDYGDWVIIKNVLIRTKSTETKDGIQSGSYVITDGENELPIYAGHTQDFEMPEDWESDTRYDMVGIVGIHGNTKQIYPTGIEKNGETITVISNINTEIKSVKYYDLTGRSSLTPFDGVNITSTEYTNGSKKINKIIKR